MLICAATHASLRHVAGMQPDVPVFSRPLLFSPDEARAWLAGFDRSPDPDRALAALFAEAEFSARRSIEAAVALLVTRRVLVFRAVPSGLRVRFDPGAPRDNAALAIRLPPPHRLLAFLKPEATRQTLPGALHAAMASEAALAWIALSERRPAAGEAVFAQAAGMLVRTRLLLMAENARAAALRLAWAIPSSAIKAPAAAPAADDPAPSPSRPRRGAGSDGPPPAASDTPGLPPPVPADSPQARAMIQAANSGTPFIQPCDLVLGKAAA